MLGSAAACLGLGLTAWALIEHEFLGACILALAPVLMVEAMTKERLGDRWPRWATTLTNLLFGLLLLTLTVLLIQTR